MENKLISKLRETIQGKKVLILGFGREGRGSLAAIERAGGYRSVAVSDRREIEEEELREVWKEEILPVRISGENHMNVIPDYDIVIKTPGIIMDPHDYPNTRMTSQTELFLETYRDQVIGITGTKGKSTTTTLLYHILKENGVPSLLLGNIGIPAFDKIDEITEETRIVFELSCHQLEYGSVSPSVSVYLNVFPEHLDHYKSYDAYCLAKENIYKHQVEGDRLYCGTGVSPEKGKYRGKLTVIYDFNRGDRENEFWKEHPEKERSFVKNHTITHREKKIDVIEEEISLKGDHNFFDIAVAFSVCSDLGVSSSAFLLALKTYCPLPHRLEYFGTFGGIKYYDDSISTIPATTIAALETIEDADTILIGGMDRGIDYSPLIEYLKTSPIPHIILMETTGRRIGEEIKANDREFCDSKRLFFVKDLAEAVKKAKEVTEKGRSCILSPAAASYGIFKNFEERGEKFKLLVKGNRK